MTPEPPSSSEGTSLPPRHRPTLGDLAKDTTELDLWAFEDDLELGEEIEAPRPQDAPRKSSREIPAPRESQGGKTRESENRPSVKPSGGGEDRIRMNINKVGKKARPEGPVGGPAKPERDFDELENWEDTKIEEPEFAELPAELPAGKAAEMPAKAALPEMPAAVEALPEIFTAPSPDEPDTSEDEFSPVIRENAMPISLRPHLGLSKVERIGLISLLVILLLGGGAIFLISLNRLPSEAEKASANDFPIKGSQFTITSATSYWRAPITDGPGADTFRRDTQLLPVLEFAVTGGQGAVRVLFRNDERTVVGDAVTRPVSGSMTMKIPATAGFDDLGMHAAYRTGESKPWTIEVYEAPSENAAGKDFKKLFEMNISAVRR